jgi:hypothetical protein
VRASMENRSLRSNCTRFIYLPEIVFGAIVASVTTAEYLAR